MAFDACMMRAVISEINREYSDCRIEKILQPANDEIDFVIKRGRASRRLVFNVGPTAPRLQLSDIAKENPLKAPMLCMLLRKHFSGARITGVEQLGFDRIAVFSVACYDEMGFPTTKRIICEIMGKYANFIVTDSEYKVLAAMKIIDFAASTIRQVLPGLKYQIPMQQEKINPLTASREDFFRALAAFPNERSGEKFITSTFSGVATQIARELIFRAAGAIDVPCSEIDAERFYSVFNDWQTALGEERYLPTAVYSEAGEPLDFSYMDISYLGEGVKKLHYGSLGELFDAYFAERDRAQRIRQRAKDVYNLLSSAKARTERKLSVQREALIESEKGDMYKRYGDLITANIYLLKRGMESFRTVDYYDEECPEIEVPLDARLSPSANAQKMYKLYTKCKTAERVLAEQIQRWEEELVYLASVEAFLSRAESEEDLTEIRDELYRSGYASRLHGYRPEKPTKQKPHTFTTSGGYTVLVGKNNIQNDRLTFKVAEKCDIWFHTKGVPGSHVILVTGGKEPSEADYTEAARIAAYFSQATGDLVAVDYTAVKNIKKPPAQRPGFVIYKTNYTAYVRPFTAEELKEYG